MLKLLKEIGFFYTYPISKPISIFLKNTKVSSTIKKIGYGSAFIFGMGLLGYNVILNKNIEDNLNTFKEESNIENLQHLETKNRNSPYIFEIDENKWKKGGSLEDRLFRDENFPPLQKYAKKLDKLGVLDYIEEKSLKAEINPYVLFLLSYMESGGNPNAISNKGAHGLTQILPTTAIDYCSEHIKSSDLTNFLDKNSLEFFLNYAREYDAKVNLKDPKIAIDCSLSYLSYLNNLDYIDSNLEKLDQIKIPREKLFNIIGAYNAGPKRIKGEKKCSPKKEIFNHFSCLKETKKYVQNFFQLYNSLIRVDKKNKTNFWN